MVGNEQAVSLETSKCQNAEIFWLGRLHFHSKKPSDVFVWGLDDVSASLEWERRGSNVITYFQLMPLFLAPLLSLTLRCTWGFQVPSQLGLAGILPSFHYIALNKCFKPSLPPPNFLSYHFIHFPFSRNLFPLSHHCYLYILNHFSTLLF